MVKIVEDELNKEKFQNSDGEINGESISLPIPVPDEKTLYKRYRGNHIAIFEGQIVAIDSSLETIYEKIEQIIPKGKRCRIRYIEKGIAIYGVDF